MSVAHSQFPHSLSLSWKPPPLADVGILQSLILGQGKNRKGEGGMMLSPTHNPIFYYMWKKGERKQKTGNKLKEKLDSVRANFSHAGRDFRISRFTPKIVVKGRRWWIRLLSGMRMREFWRTNSRGFCKSKLHTNLKSLSDIVGLITLNTHRSYVYKRDTPASNRALIDFTIRPRDTLSAFTVVPKNAILSSGYFRENFTKWNISDECWPLCGDPTRRSQSWML